MSLEQQAARVNVTDDVWIEFRTLAMRKRRSIADYLGELVQRELAAEGSGTAATRSEPPSRSSPRSRPRVTEIGGRQLLTSLPRPPQPPDP